MKNNGYLRMILLTVSYIAFLFLAFFLYNGRTSVYVQAYGEAQQINSSLPIALALLYLFLFGLGVSTVIQFGISIFTPERKKEKRCVLLDLPMSDAISLLYIVDYIFSLLFLILLTNGKLPVTPPIIFYIIMLGLHLFLLLSPSPEHYKIPSPIKEEKIDPHALEQYSGYLRRLSEKSPSPAFKDAMLALAELLDTIDPTLSTEIDLLETELSGKCVSIEDAILAGNSTKISLLTRELYDLREKIETKLSSALYAIKGESFSQTNNDIAEGLIDEILDDMNLDNEEDIIKSDKPLDIDLRFVKAVRFADPEYKEILEGYNKAVRDRLKQKVKSETAATAKNVKKVRKGILIGYALIFVFAISTLCVRTLITQKGGYLVSDRGDNTVAVIGYNHQYGTDITIPSEIGGKRVVEIGENAFLQNSSVTRISVPDGVTTISIQAFREMTSLRTLYLPSSIKRISGFVFKGDRYLTVNYAGTRENWESIFSDTGNTDLKSENVHCADDTPAAATAEGNE